MPSWVSPTLAAEYWGILEEDIRRRIDSGELPARLEGEFYFVDIAPDETSQVYFNQGATDSSASHEPGPIRLPWVGARQQSAARRRRPAKAA